MGEQRFRRSRVWSCPNHPDGPPAVFSNGYDEPITLDETDFDPSDIVLVVARARAYPPGPVRDAGDRPWTKLGVCCVGHRWARTGPWKPYYHSSYEALIAAQHIINMHLSQHTSIVLDELAKGAGTEGAHLHVPILTDLLHDPEGDT